MISPEFLMNYSIGKGIKYLYDANNDGILDTSDVDRISQAQQITVRMNNDFKYLGPENIDIKR